MKQLFFYLLFVSLLFTTACDKGSCIHGTVTDSKTGKPVPDAKFRLHYQYSEQGSLKNQEATVSTDASGEFSYSADRKNSRSIDVWDVIKKGYSGKYELDEDNNRGCREVAIKLTPLDGLLKLTIMHLDFCGKNIQHRNH